MQILGLDRADARHEEGTFVAFRGPTHMTRLDFLSLISAPQGARARDAASPGTLDFLTPAR